MAQGIGYAVSSVATFVRYYGPKMQRTCEEWVLRRLNMPVQPSRVWTMSFICGLDSIQANIYGQAPVQDATAPPSVRTGCYRVAPRTFAYKTRRIRRRSRGGGGGDEDGPEWDEGGFGGSGGWGDGDNGRGGGNNWGGSWNDEGWQWEEASDAALNLLYHVACWISLSQCLHYTLKKLVGVFQDGVDDSPGDTGAFAQCTSVFSNKMQQF